MQGIRVLVKREETGTRRGRGALFIDLDGAALPHTLNVDWRVSLGSSRDEGKM